MDDDLEVRDLFAMFALVGLISKSPFGELNRDEDTPTYSDMAFSAYEYADAMLDERNNQPQDGIAAITKRKK